MSSATTKSGVAAAVEQAAARIERYVRRTPVEASPLLSRDSGGRVLLKLESLQVSGSFKARGAFNKLLSLDRDACRAGIVTASTGNHGLATAHALAELGVEGEIFLPASASPVKIDALRLRGAKLVLVDMDPGAVETVAREHAMKTGRTYISPYNDPEVIAGQGTIGRELLEAVDDLATVYVPVGGGGLIAGIAAYLKFHRPGIRVIGVQPEASAVMTHSVAAGRLLQLDSDESISDATVGLVEEGSITFPICRSCVDDWVLVTESEIKGALRSLVGEHSILAEGAGALTVAAYRRRAPDRRDGTTVLLVSGAHVALDVLSAAVA